jgi:hypothetical protein
MDSGDSKPRPPEPVVFACGLQITIVHEAIRASIPRDGNRIARFRQAAFETLVTSPKSSGNDEEVQARDCPGFDKRRLSI